MLLIDRLPALREALKEGDRETEEGTERDGWTRREEEGERVKETDRW